MGRVVTIALALGKPVTIFGNGKQVRDVLFIEDLVDAYDAAVDKIGDVAGQAFNIGGGVSNTLSLLEFIEVLEGFSGRPMEVSYDDWRPGDQPVYISDIRKAANLLGWEPRIGVRQGLRLLYDWVDTNRKMFADIYQSA